MTTTEGIDVYGNTGPVDWSRVAGSGRTWAVAKASEGATYLDPRFGENVTGMTRAGLVAGAYHYARPSHNDARTEARAFLAQLARHDPVAFVELDFEDDRVGPGVDLTDWCSTWLHTVSDAFGRASWLYTFGPYWHEHVRPDPAFAAFPLHLAAYGSTPPAAPAPWRSWSAWQLSDHGTVPGVAGRCDLDRFAGSLADLRRLTTGGTLPPLDPPTSHGDAMQRIPVRIRTDNDGRGYADLTPAVAQTRVVSIVLGGDEPSDGWGPYVGAPAYAIAVGATTRVVVPESPVKNGDVDLVVWCVDA